MNYKSKIIVFLFFPVFCINLYAQGNSLIMHPSMSPDGSAFAFSYQGDIWTYQFSQQKLNRLTIHEAYESRPVWSPDSKKIAFSSDRNGNQDVFFVEASGSTPKQLTWNSANDFPLIWLDQDHILFATRRLYVSVEREFEVYKVPVSGGSPQRYMQHLAMELSVLPNKNSFIMTRGTCGMEREDYRGPANRDLWFFDAEKDRYKQLTDFNGNDAQPKFIKNHVFYLSSKMGRYNVIKAKWNAEKLSIESEQNLTNVKSNLGILFFDLDTAAKKMIYLQGDQLYLTNLESNKTETISLKIQTDYRFDPVVKKSLSRVDEYAVSPNSKWIAFVSRGEIFVAANDKDDSRVVRLTQTAAREMNLYWYSDQILTFASDKNGNFDLYSISSADTLEKDLFKTLKFSTKTLLNSNEDEKEYYFSPNGKNIVWKKGNQSFASAQVDSNMNFSKEKIMISAWNLPEDVSWSPDSKWIAYSMTDLEFNNEVFIHHAQDSIKAINISMHPGNDSRPKWSKDGTKLAFVSDRNNGDSDIWFCFLRENDFLKSREEWKREEQNSKEDKKDKKDKQPAQVTIDFKDLYLRMVQVTSYPTNEQGYELSHDGKTFYFIASRDGRKDFNVDPAMYSIKWDGSDLKQLADGKQNARAMQLSADGETLFYLNNSGSIQALKPKDAKSESRSYTAKIDIEEQLEWKQIFNEAWRAIDQGFYDPEFHGKNWQELRKIYEPLCLKASTKEDFQYFFNLMLGQLNASHMGLYNGYNPKQTQTVKTGQLGIEIKPAGQGVEVTSVLRNSPADRLDSKLTPGDLILSVNGETIEANQDFDSYLEDKAGEMLWMEVQDKTGKKRELKVWPQSSLSKEIYEQWVQERKDLVEKYSKGKLGYIHIQSMDWKSFENFERELMAAGYGKEAIVIDVRYNGGGWTTDYLMAVLSVKQHAYTIPRGASASLKNHKSFSSYYPYSERLPLAAWTKPSIALCNESSYSNAEIFSHAYKELKLGSLVGIPTYGAVISTGSYNLMDGSYVRMPFRGWFVKSSGMNMENGPAVPDVIVPLSPDYRAKGVDEQLKKAVDILLDQIK